MPSPPFKSKTGILFLLGLLACLGLTALVYWPGLSGPFLLDDQPNIQRGFIENPDWDAIVYTVTHNGSGRLGRSVAMLSFVLSGLQYGLDPWGFKFHSLLLHLVNGLLLLRLLQMLLPRLDPQLGERKALLIAGTTSALWLLHPLLVSTVLYVVQRMAILSTLFTLLALMAYVHARIHLGGWRFYAFGWLVLPATMLLSLLSKESGALIPVYLLVIEVCAFRPKWHDLKASPRLALLLAVFILLPLLAAFVVLAGDFDSIVDYSMRTFTLTERLLTQVHVLFFYIRLIFLPRVGAMSLFHDDFPLTTQLDLLTSLLVLLLIGVLLFAWKLRRTYPVVAFGVLLFFAAHLLESTFLALELVFEHRNYFASAGLLLLPVYGLFRVEGYPALRALCPVILLMFAFMTTTRAREWGDQNVFQQVSVIEHPQSPRALNSFANYMMSLGRYEDAIANLESLIALTPNDAGAYLHLQVAKCAKAESDYVALQRAAELAGKYPMSVYAHSALFALAFNVVEDRCDGVTVDDVEPILMAAVDYADRNQSFANYGNLHHVRAMIAMKRGLYAQGYSALREAHELTGQVEMLHELMKYQVLGGRLQDAEETLALMEQQNAAHFGIDTYVVEQSRKLLDNARQRSGAGLPLDASALPEAGEPPIVR